MKLLYIDCCITVHGSTSRTAALAETFLSAWRAAHPEADIETLDLKTLTLNPLLGNALRLRETLQGAKGGRKAHPSPWPASSPQRTAS